MTAEVINSKTVFSGFDNGTNLDPVGVRQNNQGVTLEEANAFIAVDAAAPDTAKGLKGAFSFSTAANKLEVCIGSFGEIFAGRTIPAITSPTGSAAATYPGIVPVSTTGKGSGLVVTIVMAADNAVTSITSTTAGSGYTNTDVLTIPANSVNAGGGSSSFTATPNLAAVAAEYKSVTLT